MQSIAGYYKLPITACMYSGVVSVPPYCGHKGVPLTLASTQSDFKYETRICICCYIFHITRGKCCVARLSCHAWKALSTSVSHHLSLSFELPVPERLAKAKEAERVHPACPQRYCPGTVPAPSSTLLSPLHVAALSSPACRGHPGMSCGPVCPWVAQHTHWEVQTYLPWTQNQHREHEALPVMRNLSKCLEGLWAFQEWT